MTELKPCPFCGNKPTKDNDIYNTISHRIYWVHCNGCEAIGPEAETSEEAAEAWNRRATNEG